MKQFSEMDRKYIEPIVEEINSAKSIKEGMISAYISHLPDKERNQGELMAERAFRGVDNFYKELDEALKDADRWLTRSINKLGEGKDLGERCNLYRDKIIQFLEAAKSALPQEKADALLKNAESIYMPGQDVTEETEAELKRFLKDLIMEDASLIQKMTEMMIEYAEANGEVELEYNETQERGLLAAMVMATYIAAKEGKVEGIPSDVTLDEITVLVCSTYESSKVIQQAQEGNLSWEIAKITLKVIGIVAMGKLLICATELTFVLLTLVFGTAMTWILTAVLLLTMGYWMVNYGVNLLDKGVNAFVDDVLGDMINDAKTVISFSAGVLKGATQTVKNILTWAVQKAAEFVEGRKFGIKRGEEVGKNIAAELKPGKEKKESETTETFSETEEEIFYEEGSFVTE